MKHQDRKTIETRNRPQGKSLEEDVLRSRPLFRVSDGSGEAAAPSAPISMLVCERASLIMWRSEATAPPPRAHQLWQIQHDGSRAKMTARLYLTGPVSVFIWHRRPAPATSAAPHSVVVLQLQPSGSVQPETARSLKHT